MRLSRIEYKDFAKAVLKVGTFADGKIDVGESLDVEGSDVPERAVAVIDDGKAILLSDGNGCYATVERDIIKGAGVR